MGVGNTDVEKKRLDFPHLLETEIANVRSLQNRMMDEQATERERQEEETESDVDLCVRPMNHGPTEVRDNSSDNLATPSDDHCTKICGKILRIMGDEQTSKIYGRHLRSMGDEIFTRYAIRRSLEHLVQAVANERVDDRNNQRHRPRRPSSSW